MSFCPMNKQKCLLESVQCPRLLSSFLVLWVQWQLSLNLKQKRKMTNGKQLPLQLPSLLLATAQVILSKTNRAHKESGFDTVFYLF